MAQNGKSTQQPSEAGGDPGIQVQVLGQYIKDLSFENPSIAKLLTSQPENPNLNVEINVGITNVQPNVFESAINFRAEAKASIGVIYDLEIVYAGAFRIENAPPGAMEPMLFINCPSLIFPFLRRIVADITREGGFPPLLLDPVDFAALYMRKKQLGMPPQTGANA